MKEKVIFLLFIIMILTSCAGNRKYDDLMQRADLRIKKIMRVTMVRCIFLVFFMVITTISSYGQNEEQKKMGETNLKEESLQTRDTLSYALNDVVIKGSAKSMRITDNSVIMNIANTELAKKGYVK
mgnify:FL=1